MADPTLPTTPEDPSALTAATETPAAAKERIWGRKVMLCLLGVVAVAALAIFKGDMTSKEAMDYILYLVLIGVGGIALEDGIGKIFKK